MAHFIVPLPGNRQADVRTGKIRKISLHIRQLLRLKPFSQEVNTGYIVKIAASGDIYEFQLVKSSEGKWLDPGEHYWVRESDQPLSVAIKQAIDAYEKQ